MGWLQFIYKRNITPHVNFFFSTKINRPKNCQNDILQNFGVSSVSTGFIHEECVMNGQSCSHTFNMPSNMPKFLEQLQHLDVSLSEHIGFLYCVTCFLFSSKMHTSH